MAWKSNLLNNLLVIFILTIIAITFYCRWKEISLVDFIKEIREAFSEPEV